MSLFDAQPDSYCCCYCYYYYYHYYHHHHHFDDCSVIVQCYTFQIITPWLCIGMQRMPVIKDNQWRVQVEEVSFSPESVNRMAAPYAGLPT